MDGKGTFHRRKECTYERTGVGEVDLLPPIYSDPCLLFLFLVRHPYGVHTYIVVFYKYLISLGVVIRQTQAAGR